LHKIATALLAGDDFVNDIVNIGVIEPDSQNRSSSTSNYSQGYLKSSGWERSAVSVQLLKQRGQHAFQLGHAAIAPRGPWA
jgi:hypothetical protein